MKKEEIIICEECKEHNAEYEFQGVKSCWICLKEYWLDNDLGEDTSFNDFLEFSCSKLEQSKKEQENGNKNRNS